MQESRAEIRMPSYLGGNVVFNSRYAALNCLVCNISARGGRLTFSVPTALPAFFDLVIPSRDQTVHARIIWCTETEAGIAFERPIGAQPISLDMARRIKHLEEEKRALQRRIQQLDGAA